MIRIDLRIESKLNSATLITRVVTIERGVCGKEGPGWLCLTTTNSCPALEQRTLAVGHGLRGREAGGYRAGEPRFPVAQKPLTTVCALALKMSPRRELTVAFRWSPLAAEFALPCFRLGLLAAGSGAQSAQYDRAQRGAAPQLE
jgi:hypothetical protein